MNYLSNVDLGRSIARQRKQLRLSGRDLAAKLDVHPSMVTRWEKGQLYPRDEMLKRLSEALQTTVEGLMQPGLSAPGEPYELGGLDPEFVALLKQIPALEANDQEALRAILKALLMKSRVQEMMGSVIGKAS